MTSDNLIPKQERALGHSIDYYEVIGEERDLSKRLVGVDMHLAVNEIGRFFLHVITKENFMIKNIQETFDERDHPEDLLLEQTGDSKLPFVVNDLELSDEILEKKFQGRIIEHDLAAALWPIED